MFDVLGLFAPSLLQSKILIQWFWLTGLGLDDPVPTIIKKEWNRWAKELPELATFPISRPYYHVMKSAFSRELHGFADASRLSYACAVYIRVVYTDGTISAELVYSKTKVAPLKFITITKPELSGALLLARTLTNVAEQLELSVTEAHVWTDSEIVLHWLQTTPGRLKTFESNRVTQIVSLLPCTRWLHVPSKANLADLASRGVAPSRLIASDLWWNSPSPSPMAVQVSSSAARTYSQPTQDFTRTLSSDYVISSTKGRHYFNPFVLSSNA